MVAAVLNSFGCRYRTVHHCECLFLHLEPEPFHDRSFIMVLASLAISDPNLPFSLVFKVWPNMRVSAMIRWCLDADADAQQDRWRLSLQLEP